MPFDSYQNIGTVLTEFQITATEDNFIRETEIAIADYFRADLEFSLRELVVDNSEAAICENIIYPILKEIYKSYKEDFVLWSHQLLSYNENLLGIPDYILAKRNTLGKFVFDKPYLVAVEAKKDNFTGGWGQCLAEMVAMQKINQEPERTIFGIVSNGKYWEFGQLRQDFFTKNITIYTVAQLTSLFAAINYLFAQCKLERNRAEA
ncbi:MAG: hypothetical protein SAJ37_00825 [Oscillatoria sp. PMC 1068.18]|nr:hypothetical protein [Oscillatoria sp. PMC 1076.18]MEC4987264.1 hypothetical protein [Oscillatoria sp. PMC 1068.18]